jgi:hypothetical protein
LEDFIRWAHTECRTPGGLRDDLPTMAEDQGTANEVPDGATGPTWMTPRPPARLAGSERFVGMDATVLDFWRWAFSDLRENTTRGILAEYLVAKAVGDERDLRIGWDNFDVRAIDGTTIEVKCSAYLQSWRQRTHSRLSFARLRARSWDPATNEFSTEEIVRADVFVFAVQTQRDPGQYDMLNVAHWDFWVISGATIRAQQWKSVGIGWVKQNAAGPIHHQRLASAIREVAAS